MRTIFFRKPKGKRPLEKPRRRSDDDIIMDLTENVWRLWTGYIWLRIMTSGGLL
jgi:hypothetical protein